MGVPIGLVEGSVLESLIAGSEACPVALIEAYELSGDGPVATEQASLVLVDPSTILVKVNAGL